MRRWSRLQKDEKIGFVFPIYSWAPPEIVLRFINRISLKEYQNQYLFLFVLVGMIRDLLNKCW